MNRHVRGATAAGMAAVTCLVELMMAACREAPRTETPRVDTTTVVTTTQPRGEFWPGIRFHPATLRPGTRVGELVVDSLTVDGPLIDSSYYGVVWFRGQIELSGWTHRHPDADVSKVALCFEADSASAARLPRWLGDERRPWFCFGNRAAAARVLGPPSEGIPATIVIERFAIWRGGSDEVNNASFVRLGPTSTRVAARCYRSAQSVLFGPPTSSGQQGHPPGWLRLEGLSAADTGRGELVDANRIGIAVLWRRLSEDSVSVLANGHHLRVELRLTISESVAVGSGLARSDASVERDAAGELRDLRREWVLHASRAPCDGMPLRWTP